MHVNFQQILIELEVLLLMVISIGLWNADDDILNKTNFGAFYLFLSFKIDYGFKDI